MQSILKADYRRVKHRCRQGDNGPVLLSYFHNYVNSKQAKCFLLGDASVSIKESLRLQVNLKKSIHLLSATGLFALSEFRNATIRLRWKLPRQIVSLFQFSSALWATKHTKNKNLAVQIGYSYNGLHKTNEPRLWLKEYCAHNRTHCEMKR